MHTIYGQHSIRNIVSYIVHAVDRVLMDQRYISPQLHFARLCRKEIQPNEGEAM